MSDSLEPIQSWEYKKRSPKPTSRNRFSVDLPIGHNYGYTIRTNKFKPSVREHQFFCQCGWKQTGWFPGVQAAFRNAERMHSAEVEKQYRFPV